MQPWDPRDVIAKEVWDFIETRDFANRVLRTVASVEALHGLATSGLAGASPDRPVQIVIEGLTSMRRFGLAEPDLDALLADDAIREALRSRRIDLQGWRCTCRSCSRWHRTSKRWNLNSTTPTSRQHWPAMPAAA